MWYFDCKSLRWFTAEVIGKKSITGPSLTWLLLNMTVLWLVIYPANQIRTFNKHVHYRVAPHKKKSVLFGCTSFLVLSFIFIIFPFWSSTLWSHCHLTQRDPLMSDQPVTKHIWLEIVVLKINLWECQELPWSDTGWPSYQFHNNNVYFDQWVM